MARCDLHFDGREMLAQRQRHVTLRFRLAAAQDCEILHDVCGWINAKATVPVWAKMTPNITGGLCRGPRAGRR